MRAPLPRPGAAGPAALLALWFLTAGTACAHRGTPRAQLARAREASQGCAGLEVLTVDNNTAGDVEVYEFSGTARTFIGTAHARRRTEFTVQGGPDRYYSTSAGARWAGGSPAFDEVRRNITLRRSCRAG